MMMKIASCLGATFSLSIVTTVVKNIPTSEIILELGGDDMDTLSNVSDSMHEFEDEGLWESDGDDSCRFSHDQIQLAAFQLIPSKQRDSFRREIGDILMNKLDPVALEEALFQVVSLKNCDVSHMSVDERRDLARMNLQVGLKVNTTKYAIIHIVLQVAITQSLSSFLVACI